MSINREETPEDQREITLNEGFVKKRLELLDVVGGHGPWQFRLWIVFLVATLCNSMILFSVLFVPSEVFCYLSNSTGWFNSSFFLVFAFVREASLSKINSSVELPEKSNAPSVAPTNCSSSDCATQNTSASQPTISHFFYHTECLNSDVEILARCVFVVAFGLSAVSVYFSNKRFGRRHVGLASSLFLIASSLALCFADAVPVYLILRFIISFSVGNIYFNSALTLTQYVHKDFKLLYFLTGHLGWGMAHFLLPLVSWLAKDWKSFNLVLSIMCMVLAILAWWSPDSPSSFPSSNQLSRTRKALKYAAFKNGYSTTEVDLLPHDCNFRQEIKHDGTIPLSNKQKVWRIVCLCILFLLTFTTTFIYFAAKWHTEWFKVRNGRLSFSFLGTTEVSSAIVLLFLTCVVPAKHLWAIISTLTSMLMVVTFFRDKPKVATSSAKLFTITLFFASAGWTLVLVKAFCHKVSVANRKLNLIIIAASLFIGALAASTVVLETKHYNLLLVFAAPHLIAGVTTAFMPDAVFGVKV